MAFCADCGEHFEDEYKRHEYFNGYFKSDWTLVNTLGEDCSRDGITLRFDTRENAQKFCDKTNQTPDGGLVTNFT